MIKNYIYLALSSLLIVALFPPLAGADFDHAKFDQALKTYVNDEGLVDYNGIAKDKAFASYIQSLQSADVASSMWPGRRTARRSARCTA